MSLRHFSEESTLKGISGCLRKKWRFSVTNISAPVHSQYAAIRASEDFKPLASYLAPNSNGTKMSSSMIVKSFTNLMNLAKSSKARCGRTSSTISLDMRSSYNGNSSKIKGISLLDGCGEDSFIYPNANIYSLVSRMSCKLSLPQFFSDFAHRFYGLPLVHTCKWGRFFSYTFAKVIPVFFSFFGIFSFHNLSPRFYNNSIISYRYCQERLLIDIFQNIAAEFAEVFEALDVLVDASWVDFEIFMDKEISQICHWRYFFGETVRNNIMDSQCQYCLSAIIGPGQTFIGNNIMGNVKETLNG